MDEIENCINYNLNNLTDQDIYFTYEYKPIVQDTNYFINAELISYEEVEGPIIEYSMEEIQIEKYSPNNME